MDIPTRSQVMGWRPGALEQIAADAEKICTAIDIQADTMNRTIHSLDWSGDAYRHATDRADNEKTQHQAIATAYDGLSRACSGAERDTGWAIAGIQQIIHGLPSNWTVAEDFTITAPSTADKQEVADDTLRLQDLAGHLGRAMDSWAVKIADAVNDITHLAPTTAELCYLDPLDALTPAAADDDLRAFRDGTATPTQIEQLAMATRLAPDVETNGIPSQQFAYLHRLMRDEDSMLPHEIADVGAQLPDGQRQSVQAGLANAMQIMSSPHIHAAGSADCGGMAQLPDQVRSLLHNDPLRGGIAEPSGLWFDKDGFTAMTTMINRGNPALRNGTDLDRGMMKQAAEIVGNADRWSGAPIYPDKPGELANSMLAAVSGDHRAVHDFVTGDGMAATVDHGGHYNASDHVVDILGHQWDGNNQHGPADMFSWLSDKNHVTTPLAGSTADGLAHILADNQSTLNNPLAPMGQFNPHLTQVVAGAMVPYLGNFAGVRHSDMLVNHTAQPFAHIGDLSNMFNVLDSDPGAARIINTGGAQWSDYMAYQAGMHPESARDLGETSGNLNHAMNSGLTAQINSHASGRQYLANQEYTNDKQLFDIGRTALTDWVSKLPLVAAVPGSGHLGDFATYLENNAWPALGSPGNPVPDDSLSAQLKNLQQLTVQDPFRRDYSIAMGAAVHDPSVASHFTSAPEHPNEPHDLLDWQNLHTGTDGQRLDAQNDLQNDFDNFPTTADNHYLSAYQEYNRPEQDAIVDDGSAPQASNRPPKGQ